PELARRSTRYYALPLQPKLVAARTLAKAPFEWPFALADDRRRWRLVLFRLFLLHRHRSSGQGLHRQADALLIGIDRLHFHVNDIPFLHDVAHAPHALMRQLRDMHQAFDARL